ncbi:MAG: hypothetical protein H6Q90_4963 [Deltaproteobacteria bacterium]|nr:hypothetical protein [Deltaproteobacteria bacterium]
MLAVALWLVTLACGIAFAAIYDNYTLFRDGGRATATVVKAEPPRRDGTLWVTTHYRDGDRDQKWSFPVTAGDPRAQLGATVELALHRNNGSAKLVSAIEAERPSWWVAVVGAAALVLGVWTWRVPRRAAVRRAARRDPLEAVVDAAALSRNLSLFAGVFMVLAGAGMAVIPWVDRDAKLGATIFLEILAALSIGFGVMALVRAYRLRNPRRNELFALIVEHPQDIAWCYVHELRSRAGAKLAYQAHVWKADGKLAFLAMAHEDVDVVMAEIARRAPHARFGHDEEIKRQYKEQPTRWRPTAAP